MKTQDDFIIPDNAKTVFLTGYGYIGPFNARLDHNEHVIAWYQQQDPEHSFIY